MVGNVNGIVESYYAAENARNQQNTANGNTKDFSDYLEYALLSGRGNGLLSDGLGFGSSYFNALSGNAWQGVVLQALKESLKKESASDSEKDTQQGESESKEAANGKKEDWARIRVIHHYKSPVQKEDSVCQVNQQC